MLRNRIIPCLLLKNDGLYKTIKFKKPNYIGDPINAIKIFNEKEVDELILIDIDASKQKKKPNFELLTDITSECFMPLSYGGGINDIKTIEKLLKIGIEKVIINSFAINNLNFLESAIKEFGGSTIIAAIDIKKNIFGAKKVFNHIRKRTLNIDPVELAVAYSNIGVGEIFLNDVDNDGTFNGYDTDYFRDISNKIKNPLIACGGAKNKNDLLNIINNGASAAAAGSMFVYNGPNKAVLISYI